MESIDKSLLLSLVVEASQVTAMSAMWTGNLPSADNTEIALTKYYFKWIDVAKTAVENLDDNTPENVKMLIAQDLVKLIQVPLQGMLQGIIAYAAQLSVALPPLVNAPQEIFAYKAWAIEYINKGMNLIKEAKK